MKSLFIIFAEVPSDATYYSGWDKVGAVAVCVAVITVLVMLHRNGLKRVDAISDRHMAFVEAQTKTLTDVVSATNESRKASEAMHKRLDNILTCRKAGCPMRRIITQEEDKEPP